MFALTESHFETFHYPSSEDNVRRPFGDWIEVIAMFYGQEACARACELLGEEYADCPNHIPSEILWLDSPAGNLEVFNRILERIQSEYIVG